MEKKIRRATREWIPDKPYPKLKEPLSKLKADDVRTSATEWMKFWRGEKVKKIYKHIDQDAVLSFKFKTANFYRISSRTNLNRWLAIRRQGFCQARIPKV